VWLHYFVNANAYVFALPVVVALVQFDDCYVVASRSCKRDAKMTIYVPSAVLFYSTTQLIN
jgi:hypothetical protein